MLQRTLIATSLAAFVAAGSVVSARTAQAEEAPAKYSAEELQTLVGPVALYPDIVLGTLLPATAFPNDIVAAADYVAKQGGKVAGPPEGTAWDANAQALLQYPDLLKWLKDNPDWVKQMGFAMSGQQSDVLAAVQSFRKAADEAGNLKSNEQQTVSTEDVPGTDTEVIVIEPTNPAVVYVPTYVPTAVVQPGYTGWAWGAGLVVGATATAIYRNNNVNWNGNGGTINVNNSVNVNRSASATNVNRGAAGATGANRAGAGAAAAGAGAKGAAANAGPNRPSAWQPPKGAGARPAGAPTPAPKLGGAGSPGAGPGGAGRPGGTTGPAPGAGRPGGAGPGAAPGAGGGAKPGGGAAKPAPSHGFGGASDGNKARAQSQRGHSSMGGGGGGRSSGGGGGGRSSGGGGGGRGGGGGGGRRR
jgi:hypothetical protein